jgi:hypothetical protein
MPAAGFTKNKIIKKKASNYHTKGRKNTTLLARGDPILQDQTPTAQDMQSKTTLSA